jgi:hypothetical protein
MTPALFFTLAEAELQRRRVAFDAAELLAYCEAMAPLWEQEGTVTGWADAYLYEPAGRG